MSRHVKVAWNPAGKSGKIGPRVHQPSNSPLYIHANNYSIKLRHEYVSSNAYFVCSKRCVSQNESPSPPSGPPSCRCPPYSQKEALFHGFWDLWWPSGDLKIRLFFVHSVSINRAFCPPFSSAFLLPQAMELLQGCGGLERRRAFPVKPLPLFAMRALT